MLRRQSKEKFFKTNTVFVSKDHLVTSSLREEINDWTKQVGMEVYYCSTKVIGDEDVLSFGFDSDEDRSMFILRWQAAMEDCFQNSSWRAMTKIYRQLQEKIASDEAKNIDKDLSRLAGKIVEVSMPRKKK
jgi:hypothetical protein